MRILLVDDDFSTVETIKLSLEGEDFVVDSTDLGEDGLEIAKLYDYDLIVLDLMLPDIDGHEVLRRLRLARVPTPVLILSGLEEPADKVKGFGLGADDYLTKPFDRAELIARIRTIVRRSRGHAQSIIRTGTLAVNLDARNVEVDGRTVPLSGKQYGIIELLSLRKGKMVSRDQIMDHLYGGIDTPESKVLDVFVHKIRSKLAACGVDEGCIETVWGQGFILRDQDTETVAQRAPRGEPPAAILA